MALRKFSGVVRVQQTQAKLDTPSGRYTLIPYPQQAAGKVKNMRKMGERLFGYLDGQEVAIEGTLSGDQVYNAHLVEEGGLPAQDVQLTPESKDKFALEVEQYFKKDSSQIALKLNNAGIRTVSALYHRIKNNYEQEVAAFSKYLKVREDGIKEFLRALESDTETRALVRASPRFPVRRGINLKLLAERGLPVTKKAPDTPPRFPASAVTPNLPPAVDLKVHVTPVKNQGARGTCVAHTAAACLEADLIRKGRATPKLDLSEQYLYWACKNLDGAPKEEGTFIEYAVQALLNGVATEKLAGGVCTEKAWPYNQLPKPGNEAQGPLTAAAKKMFKANRQHRALNYAKLKHNSIKALKNALATGHCIGLSVFTYHFWTDDFAWREGVISLPFTIEPDGAHAICLVGYHDNDANHGDGYFIFKNSWDLTWGYGRPDPGFGSLPYRYVIREAIEAYTVDV